MDARLIYKATNSLLYKIDWDEWIHFGTGDSIKNELIMQKVNSDLPFNEILFVLNRTSSRIIKRSQFHDDIQAHLGQDNFYLWNKDMDKVIEFQKMGVLRLGHLKK